MALFSMFANAQQISYIKADGAWYQVYDEAGKKVTTLSKSSIGEVVGWGSDFFVAVAFPAIRLPAAKALGYTSGTKRARNYKQGQRNEHYRFQRPYFGSKPCS